MVPSLDPGSILVTVGIAVGAAVAGLLTGYLLGRRRKTGDGPAAAPLPGVPADTALTILREFLRNATGPVAVKDLNGRFVLTNDKFAEIHGLTPEQLAGTEIAALYPPEKVRFFQEQDRRMLAAGATTQNEVRATRRDGTAMDLLTTRFPIRDDTGAMFAIGTINTDIGALKAVEAELRAHRDNLEAVVAQRTDELRQINAQKDRFFSIVAHDLRGPFNSILGFSAMLMERADRADPEKLKLFATHIHESSKTLFDLLNNLLDWSRLQMNAVSFHTTTLSVSAVVAEAIGQCRRDADAKDIAIEAGIEPALEVVADQTALVTVLRNAVVNAVKFSPPGGRIRVGAVAAGGRTEIEIADDGIGMDAETLAGLFDLSRRNTRPGTLGESGTGLGLYICRELVERQDGILRIHSTPDAGTVVRIVLPAPAAGPEAAAPARAPAEAQ